MIAATRQSLVHCALLLALATPGAAPAQDAMTIDADAPVVRIRERAPGRHTLRLPALDYQLHVRTHCSGERAPTSVSLNVADTRTRVKADDIVAGGATPVSMRVPAAQIPPLVVEDFCVVPEDAAREGEPDPADRRQIPAALSVQGSLLCAGDEDSVMTYASRPLDVFLLCERPGAEEPPVDGH